MSNGTEQEKRLAFWSEEDEDLAAYREAAAERGSIRFDPDAQATVAGKNGVPIASLPFAAQGALKLASAVNAPASVISGIASVGSALGGVPVNGQPQVTEAGVPLALPAALGALGSAVPALAGILGVGVAGYGILQAMGLGEGEGIFGTDLLGGDEQYLNGIPLGGPGLAEPPAGWVEKEWHVNYDWGRLQYYLVRMPTGGRKIALYNTRTKKWKAWSWRSPRLAVIGKNMPSHKMITRLRRNLKKHSADARTILKMTSPASLSAGRSYGGRSYGGRHGHARRK